jgi:hypothetical protein
MQARPDFVGCDGLKVAAGLDAHDDEGDVVALGLAVGELGDGFEDRVDDFIGRLVAAPAERRRYRLKMRHKELRADE